MAPRIQRCPMCLEVKPVLDSHLMPRSLYVHIRDGVASPILVIDDAVLPSDKHIKTYLLCADCEDVLSKGGETWVCPKLGWPDRRFPLYDLLAKHGQWVDADRGGGGMYSVHSPEIDVYKIAHFALGIFWKAGVHSWKGDNEPPIIDLGPYEEDIRSWLLDESTFPETVALELMVSRPGQMQVSLNRPTTIDSTQPCRMFLFHVLGALFILKVGIDIPEMEREICFYTNPMHPVFVSDDITQQYGLKLAKQFIEARKTESYLRARAKRWKED